MLHATRLRQHAPPATAHAGVIQPNEGTGFLALGLNEWSLPGHRSSGRMTDAVGRSSFSLSSYGFVGVPAQNADLAGLRLRIREVEQGVLG